MTDDELLAVVLRERYGPSKWWVFRPSPTVRKDRFSDDSELVCARRRKALVEATRDDERQAS